MGEGRSILSCHVYECLLGHSRSRLRRQTLAGARRRVRTSEQEAGDEAAAIARRYRRQPVAYCSQCLGVRLTPAQKQIASLLVKPPYKVLVRAAHAVAETLQATCGANA